MPAVRDIEDKLKEKSVVIIYISKDEKLDQWNKAAGKYNLPRENSYIITNLNTTEFLEGLGIWAIPHYLIYDKAGKLVQQNAPSPTSGKLEKMLIGYL